MRPNSIRTSITIAALAAQSLALAAPAAGATAAPPVDVPFVYTGDQQSWDVPTGVSKVHVVVVGAQGGAPKGSPTATGGFGARVEGDLHVNGGTKLYIEVGGPGLLGNGQGSAGGGFNGGGNAGMAGIAGYGGGGASDIRPIPLGQPGSASSAIVVAGGGGGGGNDQGPSTPGAKGGDAGQPGANGLNATGGGAGAQGVGGAAGTGSSSSLNGAAGTDSDGGKGGDGGAGGGGGGGGYGGGGGGAASTLRGGGGGGGDSYTEQLTNLSLTTDSTGVAKVTITYTPPQDNGAVHAQFSVPTSAACLELSTDTIDFGSVHLGSENTAAAPDVTVTSCSGSSEDLFAHGSDATATGVTWTLVSGSATCADTLGTDNYRMALESTAGTVGLSTANAALGTLAAGDTSTQTARIFAACPGSSGAGELMTTQITFLAVDGG